MTALLLLAACGTKGPAVAPEWPTSVAPYQGVLHILDHDGDHVVSEAEYAQTRTPASPEFSDLDRDGDGALGAEEVGQIVRSTDPLAFDPLIVPPPPQPPTGGQRPAGQPGPPPGAPGTPPGTPGAPPGASGPPPGAPGPPPPGGGDPRGARYLAEVVRFQVEELQARAPGAAVPSDAEVEAIAAQGLGSAQAQAWLPRLAAQAAEAGITWPAALTATRAAEPPSR